MFFLIASIAFAAVVGGFLVVISPTKGVSPRAIAEASAVAIGCWALAFSAPFVTEVGAPPIDLIMAVAALTAFVAAVVYIGRKVNAMWAAYFGAVLFAFAIWGVSFGIYSEYALGWQGLRLGDIDSQSDLWVGAFFFAPTSAIPGVLIGLIASLATRRARASAAA